MVGSDVDQLYSAHGAARSHSTPVCLSEFRTPSRFSIGRKNHRDSLNITNTISTIRNSLWISSTARDLTFEDSLPTCGQPGSIKTRPAAQRSCSHLVGIAAQPVPPSWPCSLSCPSRASRNRTRISQSFRHRFSLLYRHRVKSEWSSIETKARIKTFVRCLTICIRCMFQRQLYGVMRLTCRATTDQ